MKRRSIVLWSVAALVVVAGAMFLAWRRASAARVNLKMAEDDIPLAQARRGEVDVNVHANGELRASHAVMLTAPAVGGGALQIVSLVPTSSLIRKGDVVIQDRKSVV